MKEVICPVCKIPMDLYETKSGDKYMCDNHNMCSQELSASTAPYSQETRDG